MTLPIIKHIYLIISIFHLISFCNISNNPKVGDAIDVLDGVAVYYNGSMTNVAGRNITKDGYNLGLKWQCVEFVKRYYYEIYNHKMPDTYGHAKDFFDKSLPDVAFNYTRGLMQYKNVRHEKPRKGDILIYDAYKNNPYGHIGIIAEVTDSHVILIQQNVKKKTRQKLKLVEYNGIYTIADFDVLGWLRKV